MNKTIKTYKEFLEEAVQEDLLMSLLMKALHEGIEMVPLASISEGIVSKASWEINNLLDKARVKGSKPLIAEFVPEIMSLVKKFSESGQSGGSAPFTVSAITHALNKLLMQEPLGGIENTDDEWVDVSLQIGSTTHQNKRLFSIFKDGIDGKPYFINAIVFKESEKDYTFTSNSVILNEDETIGSSHYIKSFPFIPKTFVIDVISKEFKRKDDGSFIEKEKGGWWRSWIKDPAQLEEVFKYYDKMPTKKM